MRNAGSPTKATTTEGDRSLLQESLVRTVVGDRHLVVICGAAQWPLGPNSQARWMGP